MFLAGRYTCVALSLQSFSLSCWVKIVINIIFSSLDARENDREIEISKLHNNSFRTPIQVMINW